MTDIADKAQLIAEVTALAAQVGMRFVPYEDGQATISPPASNKIEALREKATGLVKPLEWTNVAVDGGFPRLQAETPFGQTMEIFVAWWGNAGKYGYVYTGSDDGPFFHTADDAKTAAQADYERRTLSALDLSELDRLRSKDEAMRKARNAIEAEQASVSGIDGYNYASGHEYGLRRALIILDAALSSLQEEEAR